MSDNFLCTTFHPNPCHSSNAHQKKKSNVANSTTKQNKNAEEFITRIRVLISAPQLV